MFGIIYLKYNKYKMEKYDLRFLQRKKDDEVSSFADIALLLG